MSDSSNTLTDKLYTAARERYEQALVDADIEGLPRSPEIEAMIAEWEAAGLDVAEQIARLRSYALRQSGDFEAAE